MNKQNGFTLIELLLVLSMWSLLVLLSVPILIKNLAIQEEQQFFRVFEYDVLYIQYLASTSVGREIHIRFSDGHYTIRDGATNLSVKRDFPASWKIDMRAMKDISFTSNGTIKYPGTIQVKTKHSTYSIVFPLGKGRGYVVKQ